MARDDILRIHQGSRGRGRLAAQRKSRATGNDADGSQFGDTKDNVARQAVGICNILVTARGAIAR